MENRTDDVRGSSQPGRCWTLTNAREASPLVLTTLEWAVWSRAVELGARGAWCDFGFLPRSAVRQSSIPDELITSCFFGRQAINVDLCREIMGQIPGSSADDFERDMLGSVRPDAKVVPNSNRRVPIIAVKAPRVLAIQKHAVTRRHSDQLEWWRDAVLGDAPMDDLDLFEESQNRFADTMRIHVRSRTLLQAFQAQVTDLSASVGREDLVPELLSGYGSVAETGIAQDLWRVSRGEGSIEEFVRAHGYHGPNEGNPRSSSWRENRAHVESLVASMRRSSAQDPETREAEAVARRKNAERELLKVLSKRKRPLARLVLSTAGAQIRNLELGKSAYVAAIDGCRKAIRKRGIFLAEQGHLTEPASVFHLTRQEFCSPSGDYSTLVAERAALHAEYENCEIPVSFIGMPQPDTLHQVHSLGQHDDPVEIEGATGCPGVIEGFARIVRSPDEIDDVEDGEIVVCAMTDPGWAPLFTIASGLVVDVGGPSSHGAIVAREMGIPCVIGTGRAMAWLKSGDFIRVDGAAGIVQRLKRSE